MNFFKAGVMNREQFKKKKNMNKKRNFKKNFCTLQTYCNETY